MNRFVYLLIFLFCSLTIMAEIAKENGEDFIKAPYKYEIKKNFFKKRYGDITTNGRFAVYKIVFTNEDSQEHTIDYDCFFLTDADGAKYEVHAEATIVRQTYFEDWRVKDIDVMGLNNKTIKPKFQVEGFLVFEIPRKAAYQLNFRGYLK